MVYCEEHDELGKFDPIGASACVHCQERRILFQFVTCSRLLKHSLYMVNDGLTTVNNELNVANSGLTVDSRLT